MTCTKKTPPALEKQPTSSHKHQLYQPRTPLKESIYHIPHATNVSVPQPPRNKQLPNLFKRANKGSQTSLKFSRRLICQLALILLAQQVLDRHSHILSHGHSRAHGRGVWRRVISLKGPGTNTRRCQEWLIWFKYDKESIVLCRAFLIWFRPRALCLNTWTLGYHATW